MADDAYKQKTARSKPSQARSKERVRRILASALELFKQRGIEAASTNDIAGHAGIPIGSLYRYYPNKESIIAALTEQYATDVSKIFASVAKHPMLPYLSWEEVLGLMVDGWADYSRTNGPFTFLYAEVANPTLHAQNVHTWQKFTATFVSVLKKRCPSLPDRQALICFKLCTAAVEMGVEEGYQKAGGPGMHHEAVSVVAAYMLRICGSYEHHNADVLA